jgi:hypothetical protein
MVKRIRHEGKPSQDRGVPLLETGCCSNTIQTMRCNNPHREIDQHARGDIWLETKMGQPCDMCN